MVAHVFAIWTSHLFIHRPVTIIFIIIFIIKHKIYTFVIRQQRLNFMDTVSHVGSFIHQMIINNKTKLEKGHAGQEVAIEQVSKRYSNKIIYRT